MVTHDFQARYDRDVKLVHTISCFRSLKRAAQTFGRKYIMKFNKSSLLSSLAVAGIVLGAVAPFIANADTAPVFDNSKQLHAFNSTTPYVTAVGNLDGQTLESGDNHYATNADSNQTSGSAVGVSDAQVRLISGYLTLDRVPDFNFGTVAAGTPGQLQNNSGAITDDGNSNGILKVTDSRSTTGSSAGAPGTSGAYSRDGMGYTVSVALGSFWSLTNGQRTGTSGFTSGFQLHIPTLTNSDKNTFIQADKGTKASMTGVDLVAGGPVGTILSAPRGSSYGSTSVFLTPAAGITLDTSSQIADGAYDAPITWTLASVAGAANPAQP